MATLCRVLVLDAIQDRLGDYAELRDIGALQARHLISRGYTRLRFAHLEDARQDPFGEGREAGAPAMCAEHGLPEPHVVRLGIDLNDAATALDTFASPGAGVACYNDDVATALPSAATMRGWQVPRDLGLIGMDHTPLSGVTLPPLTTIGYDLEAAAYNLITATHLSVLVNPRMTVTNRGSGLAGSVCLPVRVELAEVPRCRTATLTTLVRVRGREERRGAVAAGHVPGGRAPFEEPMFSEAPRLSLRSSSLATPRLCSIQPSASRQRAVRAVRQ